MHHLMSYTKSCLPTAVGRICAEDAAGSAVAVPLICHGEGKVGISPLLPLSSPMNKIDP